jgi:hypothetical protein
MAPSKAIVSETLVRHTQSKSRERPDEAAFFICRGGQLVGGHDGRENGLRKFDPQAHRAQSFGPNGCRR